jgi:hypothetical protein
MHHLNESSKTCYSSKSEIEEEEGGELGGSVNNYSLKRGGSSSIYSNKIYKCS